MQIIHTAKMPGKRFGLGQAIAVSLLLHVLLLWPAVTVWPEAASPVPLVASLRPASPVMPAATPIMPKSTERKDEEQKPKPTPPIPLVDAAEPADAEAEFPSSSTIISANGSASEAPEAEASVLPAERSVDAGEVRAYRLALASAARRHRHYPPMAIDAGWSGTTELRVSVASDFGVIPEIRLKKSSGHSALDVAALEMMRLATSATPVPPSLRKRDFAVDLPIVFELPE